MSNDDRVVARKGPYIIQMEPGTYWWCACGRSKNQPFCDGSHAGTGCQPVRHEVKTRKRVAWCGCKYSERGPICDGAHNKL